MSKTINRAAQPPNSPRSKTPSSLTVRDTSGTEVAFAAWMCLTEDEKELLLPRLLGSMSGWQKWKDYCYAHLWLDHLFVSAGISV